MSITLKKRFIRFLEVFESRVKKAIRHSLLRGKNSVLGSWGK